MNRDELVSVVDVVNMTSESIRCKKGINDRRRDPLAWQSNYRFLTWRGSSGPDDVEHVVVNGAFQIYYIEIIIMFILHHTRERWTDTAQIPTVCT